MLKNKKVLLLHFGDEAKMGFWRQIGDTVYYSDIYNM